MNKKRGIYCTDEQYRALKMVLQQLRMIDDSEGVKLSPAPSAISLHYGRGNWTIDIRSEDCPLVY